MATSADAQNLITAARCAFCLIPPGMVGYVTLAVLVSYGNDMPIPSDPQQLIALSKCLDCIPPGMIAYVILAVLIDISNGVAVPTDTNQLLDRAKCLLCIPPGMLPYATLTALQSLP